MSESMQKKLGRVRPPRVQITYDVETGGAIEKKELPFVVGILAPLSGKSKKPAIPMAEKKLVYIDRDNFNKILESIAPRVSFSVPNTLPGKSGDLMVGIDFKNIDGFNPVAVVKEVPELNELYMQRCRLRDFLAKLDGNQDLVNLLSDIFKDSAARTNFLAITADPIGAKLPEIRKVKDKSDREKQIKELFADLLKTDNAKGKELRLILEKGSVVLEENQIPYALELIAEFVVLLTELSTGEWKDFFDVLDKLYPSLTELKTNALKEASAKTPDQDKIKTSVTASKTGLSLDTELKAITDELTKQQKALSDEQAKDKPDKKTIADLKRAVKKLQKRQTRMESYVKTLAKLTKSIEDVESSAEITKQLVNKLIEDVSSKVTLYLGNFDSGVTISRKISYNDQVISRQLNYIIHHEDFLAMEASWRGLHYLVMNTETSTRLKLRLLNVTLDELYKDLDKAVEFDQSTLFKLVYEEEYGTYGGKPYSVLIGDYQLGRSARDIKFLEMISGVAAAAHAPFIASAWAKLFDLDDYANLYKPRDLSKIFESAELIQWQAFREQEDSRYVSLTLPKVMLRLPYHHEDNPVEGIYFDEDVAVTRTEVITENGEEKRVPVTKIDQDTLAEVEKTEKRVDASKILWGNPAYIMAQRITNAFALYGWTAAIRGVEGGGLIEGLPAYTFETEDGEIALSCPTQVSITDRREKELNDLGFMSICHCKGTNKAAFFGGQTTNKPKAYLTDSATANSRISAMLPYILSASRFAHYIKVLMREKIGSFMTKDNVQAYLNTWIAQFVLLDDSAPQHIKAQFPLREALIDVTDVAGKPGVYKATVFLRPHFQLEELSTSIRLVAELPS